ERRAVDVDGIDPGAHADRGRAVNEDAGQLHRVVGHAAGDAKRPADGRVRGGGAQKHFVDTGAGVHRNIAGDSKFPEQVDDVVGHAGDEVQAALDIEVGVGREYDVAHVGAEVDADRPRRARGGDADGVDPGAGPDRQGAVEVEVGVGSDRHGRAARAEGEVGGAA